MLHDHQSQLVAAPTGHGEAVGGVLFAGVGDEAASDLAGQIDAVGRQLGWQLIELRTVDGVPLAELDDRAFDRCVASLAAAGLSTACVDSRIAGWSRPVSGSLADDLAELDVLAARCAALGTRYVRIMSYPNDGLSEQDWVAEVLRRTKLLARRAEDSGLVLLHENCSGWAGTSAERMLRLVEETDSPALRLMFDTGNGAAYGYPSLPMLTELLDRAPELVAHVHVKDAVGAGDDASYTMPGDGESDVAACLRLLVEHDFTGVWSIEPHVNVQPHKGLFTEGRKGVPAFVEYGRRLESLVWDEVLGSRRPGGGPR
ncbi:MULTISPECIES: sugar phosphate isomerase/epimerase family protein [unclassified Streptomyces]|uniref:sugar phosphate isomerase/epimerase family protein n=1 Tax=unclassified Streptomyces TaxID=2593676 RepID=UPI002E27EA9A|nr:sugar phosphate isomerase/epimerase family protein [Streptomyces sp. NBC_00223]